MLFPSKPHDWCAGRPDPFIAWLVGHSSAVESGSAYYDEFPVTLDTHLVRYYCVVSVVVLSFRIPSRLYVVGKDAGFDRSMLFSLASILFGWWEIPWGITWTISSIATNFSGGERKSVRDLIDELRGHKRAVLKLTESAANELRSLMKRRGFSSDTGVRITPGGSCQECEIQFDLPESDGTQWVFRSGGLTLLVDKHDFEVLSGTMLDFHEGKFEIQRPMA